MNSGFVHPAILENLIVCLAHGIPCRPLTEAEIKYAANAYNIAVDTLVKWNSRNTTSNFS